MVDDFEMLAQRFAADGQTGLQDQAGFLQCDGAAFDCIRVVNPLDQDLFSQTRNCRVQAMDAADPAAFFYFQFGREVWVQAWAGLYRYRISINIIYPIPIFTVGITEKRRKAYLHFFVY